MPRRRRDCPICSKKNLAKLSNHLADIHQLSGKERQHYLSKTRFKQVSVNMRAHRSTRSTWELKSRGKSS